MLFGAIGYVNGAGIFKYHYSLIRALLINPIIFLLVLIIWLLYAKKCEHFILNALSSSEYSFLQILAPLHHKKLFGLLIAVQVLLFLPVIAYAIIICIAGIYLKAYLAGSIILIYISAVCLLSARWYMYKLQHPEAGFFLKPLRIQITPRETPYWIFFIRYILKKKKLLFAGTKIFCCCILYGMLKNQAGTVAELNMIILFFSLGILGHGLLIHQIRELEETRLTFYRAVPISLFKRFIQYAVFYMVILIPEILTISLIAPGHLNYSGAFLFVFFAYSLLLFMHSLLFIRFFQMKEYLKIILCIFLSIYFSLLTSSFPWLCIFLLLSSPIIFRARYYRYERQMI
jgi:hypothetical protein